ncbi:MAG: hypothetical protein ABI969_15855 [bacterium]
MIARRVIRAAALVPLLAGCALARTHGDRPPVLDTVRPDSVLVAPGRVVEVTLTGSGFLRGMPGENTVWFGSSVMRGVASSDHGRRITFVVPDAMDSGGEAPPARLISGLYPVQVETALGKSNVLMLKVFR